MARKWLKSGVPDSTAERLGLMVSTANVVPLSAEQKRQVDEILKEWICLNELALALGVHLTKHDYREFMLRKIGVKA
jgi:hypothetical protein